MKTRLWIRIIAGGLMLLYFPILIWMVWGFSMLAVKILATNSVILAFLMTIDWGIGANSKDHD